MFTEMESLYIKAGRISHKIPQYFLDSDVLEHIKWQDLGYTYKRRLAIELFKVKHGLVNQCTKALFWQSNEQKQNLEETVFHLGAIL